MAISSAAVDSSIGSTMAAAAAEKDGAGSVSVTTLCCRADVVGCSDCWSAGKSLVVCGSCTTPWPIIIRLLFEREAELLSVVSLSSAGADGVAPVVVFEEAGCMDLSSGLLLLLAGKAQTCCVL